MSIVRVGLAETKNFSDGYDLIFGKKEAKEEKQEQAAEQKQEKPKEPEKK